MTKLKPLPGSELTVYVVELLAKQKIITIRDFLTADIFELSRKSNLSRECIQELQSKLQQIHCPKRQNLLQTYKNNKKCFQIYGFGIESLDNLLGSRTFNNNSVFEIFGVPAIGKTRFCHTVAVNLVRFHKVEALYIDTKQDFSGCVLYQILSAQNIEKSECGQIMQRIKVERTWTLQGVYDVLKNLEELLKAGDALVTAIKLVIIDSLPAVWFTLNGDEERHERKYLACQIGNLLYKLAKEYFMAILLVNLAIEKEREEENAVTTELEHNAMNLRQSQLDSNFTDLLLKPALGRYWSAVPHVRLCMKMPDGVNECASQRLIEITRNCYGPHGGSCLVHSTDAGIN